MTAAVLDVGVASRALSGERSSGDRHVIQPWADGVLVGVVDGVGHGEEAARAAERAVEILRAHPDEPVVALLRRCHAQLRGTRGAAMSLASIDRRDGSLSWAGVGNVEGALVHHAPRAAPRHEHILLRGGLCGVQMVPPLVARLAIQPGDLLALATDGMRGDLVPFLGAPDPPQRIADLILRRNSTGRDDALVLVARYLGEGA